MMHRGRVDYTSIAKRRGSGAPRCGFTLIETLVVVGIVSLLVSIIMPAISVIRGEARLLQCSNNIRQLCIAFQGYANENRGRFPMYKSAPAPGMYWYDQARIPMYIGDYTIAKLGKTGAACSFAHRTPNSRSAPMPSRTLRSAYKQPPAVAVHLCGWWEGAVPPGE